MARVKGFSMPKNMNISGRSSSITNAFINGIVPSVKPSSEQVLEVLKIFDMSEDDVKCAYCGDKSTEWDHLRPLVKDQKPTGYISEIHNLVPACGKCNQSKGNRNWKDWMLGYSIQAVKIKKLEGFNQRIEKLKIFENWGNIEPLNIKGIIDDKIWTDYWEMHSNLLDEMSKCQVKQNVIKETMNVYYGALQLLKQIEDNK